MAFYVVGPGGLASADAGRTDIQPTGTLAALGTANYYPSADDPWSATTPPVAGDFILIANTLNESIAAQSTWGIADGVNDEVTVISVSELDLEQFLPGAAVTWSDGQDLVSSGNLNIVGLRLTIGDDFNIAAGDRINIINGVIELSGDADTLRINGSGACLNLIGTDIESSGTNDNTGILLNNGCFTMQGGQLINPDGQINFINGGQNGALYAMVDSVDLRQVSGALFAGAGAGAADDNIEIIFRNCARSGTAIFNGDTMSRSNQVLTASHCSSDGAGGEFQNYRASYGGVVQDNTVITRLESAQYPSGQRVSFQAVTNAFSSKTRPFEFPYATRFAELTSSSTIRIRFVSQTVLTTGIIWFVVRCRTVANPNVYAEFTTRPVDILSDGVEFSDDSGNSTWQENGSDLVGYNEYFVDVDTSSIPCVDSIPEVKCFISSPSTTVNIDSVIGVQ